MKKHELVARVQYEIRENKREGYSIQIKLKSGEWGEYIFFPMIAREGTDEKAFVHWSILKKLAELQGIGYKVELPW